MESVIDKIKEKAYSYKLDEIKATTKILNSTIQTSRANG